MKKFIKTEKATKWGETPFLIKVINVLFFFLRANPGYEKYFPVLAYWYIEFDENSDPWREIGFDEEGNVLFKGPNSRDYGFWLDTDMKFENFPEDDLISEEEFENKWRG